jgi:hypothetical protein
MHLIVAAHPSCCSFECPRQDTSYIRAGAGRAVRADDSSSAAASHFHDHHGHTDLMTLA